MDEKRFNFTVTTKDGEDNFCIIARRDPICPSWYKMHVAWSLNYPPTYWASCPESELLTEIMNHIAQKYSADNLISVAMFVS